MVEIVTGLAATKTGLDLIRTVREMFGAGKVSKEDVLAHLGQLHESLLETREALADAQENERKLKGQLEDQKRRADISEDMEYVEDGGFYIRKSEKAAGKHIAYCPLCWKAANADVPLNPGSGRGYYQCAIHKTSYETAAHRSYLKEQNRPRASGPVSPWH